MTFHVPVKRRPVLRKKAGIWWCSDPVACGIGPDQKSAYKDWEARRDLVERMHSNQLQLTGCGAVKMREYPPYTEPYERHGGYYNEHGAT